MSKDEESISSISESKGMKKTELSKTIKSICNLYRLEERHW